MAELGSSRMLREWMKSEYDYRDGGAKPARRSARAAAPKIRYISKAGKEVSGKKYHAESQKETKKRISGKRETIRKSVGKTPGAKSTLRREETAGYETADEKRLDKMLDLHEKRRTAEVNFAESILKVKQAEKYKQQGKMDDRRWSAALETAKEMKKYEEIDSSEIFTATQAIYEGRLGARPEAPKRPEGITPFGAPSPETQQFEQDIFKHGRDVQNWKDTAAGRRNITEKYPTTKYGMPAEESVRATTPEEIKRKDTDIMNLEGLRTKGLISGDISRPENISTEDLEFIQLERLKEGGKIPADITEEDIQYTMREEGLNRNQVLSMLQGA